MLTKKSIVLVVFIGAFFGCQESEVVSYSNSVIPVPSQKVISNGAFILNSDVAIETDSFFKVSSSFLKNYVETGSSIVFATNGKSRIQFVKDESVKNQEGYHLDIDQESIVIRASNDQGAFYAVQTLRQLLPPEFENGTYQNDEVIIETVSIKDAPEFSYRGMHLDVGRHMFPVEFIKKYIDALALLKMNTFHWHLTEDQGWRIEIKRYPKLQEVAAYRNETLIGHYSDQPHQFDGERYGGFYRQEEVKAIVAYAQSRHVTIIPEIELPGHSQAAISAYPELGCTGEQVVVATKWGVFEDIYCSKDETFEFLENVLDEVVALFPGEYIHIGGDEAPKARWENCDDCQKRMQQEGLKDEHELQSYFISRIEQYLNSKGKQIIGWDEILEGGLAPNATVMSWRGTNGAIEAAKQGHNVVLTPGSHCYFDHYQSENEDEPLAIGGFTNLEKVFNFDPIPEELSAEEMQYVLGAQGNVWTEYMSNSKQVEYMVFPRILAMSEVVWSYPEERDYKEFVSRVENFQRRLNLLDINYANHLYELKGNMINDDGKMSFQLDIESKGKSIRYTLDNTEPSFQSILYENPIVVDTSMTIKAAVFDGNDKVGKTFQERINYHKAVGKMVTLNVEPHNSYQGSGKEGMINGISGSDKRYGDKEWLGFWGDDLEITIDLDKETQVNSIELRFHNGQGQWIYAPRIIEFGVDDHGIDVKAEIPASSDNIVPVTINLNERTQKIYLRIPNYGIIPEGRQGAGKKAWTFIDEIIVN